MKNGLLKGRLCEVNMISDKSAIDAAVKAAEDWTGTKPLKAVGLGGGSYGRAALIELDREPYKAVVKSYLLEGAHRVQAEELKLLRGACGLIPEVYKLIDRGGAYKYDVMIMEYMEGVCPFHSIKFRSPRKRREFDAAVADALDAVHGATSENGKFGALDDPKWDTWEEYYYTEAEKIIKTADRLFSESVISDKICALAHAAFDNFDRIFYERTESPCLVHGDLNLFNMLVDKKSFKLTGIIDPLNSAWADPAYDLFQLMNYRETDSTYRECLGRLPNKETTELRAAFYALFNELKCAGESGVVLKRLFNRQAKNLMSLMRIHSLN